MTAIELTEPTADQCSSHEPVEWVANDQAHKGFACWYPSMGGYVGKCIVERDTQNCFDVYVWHDGEFPFSADNGMSDGNIQPVHLHHCVAEHFIDFGNFLESLKK